MTKSYAESVDKKSNIIRLIVSVIVATMVSLALILLFALIIKWFDLSDKFIMPVNITIKVISIAIGTYIATKERKGGIKNGIIVGLSYILLSFIIYSIMLGKLSISIKLLYDFLLGVAVGPIFGIIFVNIRK